MILAVVLETEFQAAHLVLSIAYWLHSSLYMYFPHVSLNLARVYPHYTASCGFHPKLQSCHGHVGHSEGSSSPLAAAAGKCLLQGPCRGCLHCGVQILRLEKGGGLAKVPAAGVVLPWTCLQGRPRGEAFQVSTDGGLQLQVRTSCPLGVHIP